MPALAPTGYRCEVMWLGICREGSESLKSHAVSELSLLFEGLEGARHAGLLRPSCARVVQQHPKGTPIRNTRQISIVSQEELDAIAAAMGLESLPPGLLGANIVVRGLPDFTHIPPASRLQGPSGATLCVDMENHPCQWPGREIEALFPGRGRAFRRAAKGRRGVTAAVEREGRLSLGDVLRLHIPAQRPWAPES